MAIMQKFSINQQSLLEPVIYCPSPHHDERPADLNIDMVVIHGISLPPGEFGGSAIQDFFCGKLAIHAHPYFASIANLKVSAHLLIKRDGTIIQFVPFAKRAWHAGESFFAGKTRCNDFSIGIELEGTDDIAYEMNQYATLIAVIDLLMQYYPAITEERVLGHMDIAPGRKTDPGLSFDWAYFKSQLKGKR